MTPVPEPQTWNVDRTGDGRAISWNGKPIPWQINHDQLSTSQLLKIQAAIEDVAPRVGSGNRGLGPTTRKPLNGKTVHLLGIETKLFVYVKDFALISGVSQAALAFVDKHTIGDEIVAAVMVFNKRQLNEGDDFVAICRHEAGHVVGLEHPLDNDQVMGFDLQPWAGWRYGDLDGFEALQRAH